MQKLGETRKEILTLLADVAVIVAEAVLERFLAEVFFIRFSIGPTAAAFTLAVATPAALLLVDE